MTQIEKTATGYADEHFIDEMENLMNRPWPEAKEMFAKILADFASSVLSSQWVRAEDRLPEDREHIIICYQSYHEGRYLTLYMTDRYDKESGFNGGWIKPEQVIAWMPIVQPEIAK